MAPVRQVISGRFTAYGSWTNMAGRTLCAACSRVYAATELRRVAHRITRGPDTVAPLSAAELHVVLSGPIGADEAVTVPTAGRKHLLPDARWSMVTVDDVSITWTDGDRDRLAAMARLRGYGFSEPALTEPEPAHRILTAHPHHLWPEIFDDWMILDPWRGALPWWHTAIRATRHVAPHTRRTA